MPLLRSPRSRVTQEEAQVHFSSLQIEPASPGFFASAHGFTLNQPTMISQIINSHKTVIEVLLEAGAPDAIHDSSGRTYPPKCHPDTRKSLKIRIVKWSSDPNRSTRILWVMGPAAVGKSAVGQTSAEELYEAGQLAASFFFSRNHLDNPNTLIPTLAYQLTVKLPQYKHIVTQRIADDPRILRKNRRAQFRELISEPFGILVTQNPEIASSPFVIVIDGLDECSDQEAQCEFIELISGADQLPFLWVVFSRPEYHLKAMLSHADFHIDCLREDILIDDEEAQQDAQRLLSFDFSKIRHKYGDQLDPNWPPEGHVRLIATAASGHLGFASFLLKFIGDKEYSDPQRQLETCVRFIGGAGPGPGAINPLHALDLLYRQVLSDVPADCLETAMRILSLIILYPCPLLSTQDIANFLSLSKGSFYRSLQRLHSVIFTPSAPEAYRISTRVHHASFSDCLKDPSRSGKFVLNEAATHYDVAKQSLRWWIVGRLPRSVYQIPQIPPNPIWIEPFADENHSTAVLRQFSAGVIWKACCAVSGEYVSQLLLVLSSFPFCDLQKQDVEGEFPEFLAWLYSQDRQAKNFISIINLAKATRHNQIPARTNTITLTIRDREKCLRLANIFFRNPPRFPFAMGLILRRHAPTRLFISLDFRPPTAAEEPSGVVQI